jgi:hypothetical protein
MRNAECGLEMQDAGFRMRHAGFRIPNAESQTRIPYLALLSAFVFRIAAA